ncbi:paralemmin-3 isoform X1 [Emydura macquarii macquarii]|uniref:paralemmin-3 isoform X1 n=1 Tax=Emydura macquarii macquarii TaxID=1129001 RepID=UPI00352B54D7
MAESSLYTQRLEAIVGRRKVQERILRTRRELEEEKLRAQQLKRKSLRDRWLMEGTCPALEENDPISPLWQTQSRIQELEQDLSSLQSQMQQLDNPEPQGRPQEDAKQPAWGTCETPGTGSAGAGEGGCGSEPEPALCLAPVPPKRATRAAARETLQNGDASGAVAGLGPGKGETEASCAAPGMRWAQPPDDRLGAAAASAKPPEKPGVGKAEMIIRNHLGQEVGSMDAIGRTPLGPEGQAPGAETGLEAAWDGSTEREQQSLDGGTPQTAELEESVAGAGSREGPEGESWVQEGEAQGLPDENGCLDSTRPRPDGELIGVVEVGEISAEAARGARGAEEAKDAREAQGSAAEAELGATQGRGPAGQDCAREEKRQECPGAEHCQATGVEEGAKTKASLQRQSPSPHDAKAALGNQIPSAPPQVKTSLQGQIPSLQEAKAALQDQIPSLQEANAALQDQIPSLQEANAALQDQIPSLQEANAALQDQIPSLQDQIPSLQDQIPSLQEANAALWDQIPAALQEAEASVQDQIQTVQEQIPSALLEVKTSPQGQIPSPQEVKAAVQHQIPLPQEANAALQDQIPSMQDQIPSAGQEANTALQDQIPSMQDQIPSAGQEANTALQDQIPSMQDQIPSAGQEAQAPLQDQIPSPQEAKHARDSQILSSPEQILREVPLTQGGLPPSGAPSPEQAPALPSESAFLKGGGDVGPVSSAAEETPENLEKLPPEQQPLLKEASGLRTGRKEPLGSTARSPQPGPSPLKSQAATSPEALTYSTTSANTASPCQARSATASRPGDGQETGRRKQKTCQCCCVM